MVVSDPVPAHTEGQRLVREWLGAQEGVQRAARDLSIAQIDERNAHAALAKWLMPKDMKPDEKIAVWMGDSLIQVELVPNGGVDEESAKPSGNFVPRVTVRTRGRSFP